MKQLVFQLMIAMLVATVWGCSSGKGKKSNRSATADSGESVVAEDTGNDDGADADGGEEDGTDGFQEGQNPVPISGINLTYDNARTRCDYKETQPGHFDIICQATAIQSDGTEAIPATIAEGVQITWQAAKELSGQVASSDCTGNKTTLSYKCSVETGAESMTKLQFDLKVVNANSKQTKTESAVVTLPYSVSVAAGFVPMIPFLYHGYDGKDETTAALQPTEKIKRGFELVSYPTNNLEILGMGSLCFSGDTSYTWMGVFVVKIENGKMEVFAGTGNAANINSFDHRYRISMRPFAVECLEDGILVSDQVYHRILKIREDGPVEVIAGKSGVEATSPAPDGTKAKEAALKFPRGVRKGPDGLIYFVDGNNFMLRKINADGTLATVAGKGTLGNGGDNGPAKDATFGSLSDFVFAADGSIYIADITHHVIRKISKTGTISTFAGSGTARYVSNNPNDLAEPTRLATDKNGNVYVTEYFRGVKKITPEGTVSQFIGGDEIPERASTILENQDIAKIPLILGKFPYQSLAIGPDGYLYADDGAGIARYDLSTGAKVSSFVGKSGNSADCVTPVDARQSRFYEPSAMVYDESGNLNVLDWRYLQSNYVMVKQIYRDSNGQSKVVNKYGCTDTPEMQGNNLSGFAIAVNSIGTIAVAPDGTSFVTNMSKHQIYKISVQGIISVFAGTGNAGSTGDGGLATAADLVQPIGIARASDGSIFFVEYGSGKVRKIAPDGIITTVVNTAGIPGDEGEGGLAVNAKINANTIAIGPDGNLFLADFGNHKIKMVDMTTGMIKTIAGTGTPTPDSPTTVALSFNISSPSSIAVTNAGRVYFTDFGSLSIRELTKNTDGNYSIGTLTTIIGSGSDCGTGRQEGLTTDGKVDDAIKNSMSIICKGLVRAVTVHDTCPSVGGSTKIAFSQNFHEFGNVVEIERPCMN